MGEGRGPIPGTDSTPSTLNYPEEGVGGGGAKAPKDVQE